MELAYSLFFYVYKPWWFWKLNCEVSVFPKFFKQRKLICSWKYESTLLRDPNLGPFWDNIFHLFHDYLGIIFLLPMNFIIFVFLK